MELMNEVREEVGNLREIMNIFGLKDVNKLQEKLDLIQYHSNSNNRLFNIDKMLFEVHSEIRKSILIRNTQENLLWKSPKKEDLDVLTTSIFEYERGRTAEKLEEVFKKANDIKGEVLFFRSGMSILDHLLKLATVLYKSPDIVQNSYYYENLHFSKNCYSHLDITYVNTYQQLYNEIYSSKYDVIITELVDANTMMSNLSIDNLVKNINQSSKDMVMCIIDSTLWCEEINWDSVINRMNKKCMLFIYRSFLKLDQFGMELANSGLLEIYTSDSIHVHKILQFLICSRSWTGTCLEYLDERILLNKDLVYPEKRRQYKKMICENSNILKSYLERNNKIIINSDLKYSPVVIFKVLGYEKSDYQELLNKWEVYQNEHNCFSYKGTSLGFRYLRMELIEPEEGVALRISTGYHKGDVFYKLMDFFKEEL